MSPGAKKIDNALATRASETAPWQTGNPPIREGAECEFIVAVRRKHNGKVYVCAATFANKYDDEMIDRDGETFIADGWFTCGADMSGEVSSVYAPLLESGDEVLGWQSLPIWGPAAGSKREAAPKGSVRVPMLMTRAMREAVESEEWQWEDVLAAAEAVTADEYNAIARAVWAGEAISSNPTDQQILDIFYEDRSIDACDADTIISFGRDLLAAQTVPAIEAAPVAVGDARKALSLCVHALVQSQQFSGPVTRSNVQEAIDAGQAALASQAAPDAPISAHLLDDLRRKIAAAPRRQFESAPGVYTSWLDQGAVLDILDAAKGEQS